MREEKYREDDMIDILRMVAPGTPLREGLENILRARTGALIAIGDSPEVLSLVDGGFNINSEYLPAQLYELAKMDGAIVLSKDLKKFLVANALLIPSSSIQTNETGTRHKTAERVAKQTNETVICISQRRNLITIYNGTKKHILRDTATIVTKANQALQTLEKYRAVLDQSVNNLSALEFEDVVTLYDVAEVLQKTEMVMHIVDEIDRYISELGNEARLISMQLDELRSNVENDGLLVIEDYMVSQEKIKHDDVFKNIRNLSNEGGIDLISIGKALGFQTNANSIESNVFPKGYRILSKVPRLPMSIVRNVVEKFDSFQDIIGASIDKLDDVDGIGAVRAKYIREGIKRIHEQIIWDNLKK